MFIVDSIHPHCPSSSLSIIAVVNRRRWTSSSSLSSDRRTRKSLLRLPRVTCTAGNPSIYHPQHAHLLTGPHLVPSCLLCCVSVGGVSTSTLDRWWRQATLRSFYQRQLSVIHHLILTVQSAPSHVHRTNLERCVDRSAPDSVATVITNLERHQPISTGRYARRHCFNPTFILEQCQRL